MTVSEERGERSRQVCRGAAAWGSEPGSCLPSASELQGDFLPLWGSQPCMLMRLA